MSLEIPFSAFENFSCPLSHPSGETITLGHGSGGTLTENLIKTVFSEYLRSEGLSQGNDAASLPIPAGFERIAISTDSHVVAPLFFPGGDIGRLSVCGTVNDLLTAGAEPKWLSAGFILEEGLPIETLRKILASMRNCAEEAGVEIVTADTKVTERGKCDGIFINTTGIGFVSHEFQPDGRNARPGDIVLISGRIADHGLAVLCARGNMGIQADIRSDAAPLTELVRRLKTSAPHIRVLRDPTRGGLGTTLNEIANQSHVSIELSEEAIPIAPESLSVCEMLGLDPLHIANEGKMVVVAPEAESLAALNAMRQSRYGTEAAIIGRVAERRAIPVFMKTTMGSLRAVDALPGEMLPRIC